MAEDQLAIELFIDDKAADLALSRFRSKLEAVDREIGIVGKDSGFGKQMQADIQKSVVSVQNLRTTLRDTTLIASQSNSPIWKTYATGANQAATQARLLYGQLREIQITASRTTDPRIFASLREQAATTGAQIDALDQKMRRVAAGRAAAAGRAPAGFNTSGLLGAAGGLGIPGAGQAAAGVEAAALLGVSTAALTALAAGAVAIAAAKVGSEYIRDQAERRLRTEEMIAGAMNRQVLASREIAENFDRALQAQASNRDFSRFLQGGSIEDLQRRFENLKRVQDIGPNTDSVDGKTVESEASKKRREQMLAIEAQIATLQRGDSDAVSTAFENRFRTWQRAQAAEAEAAKRFAESVAQGKRIVSEYKKEVFDLSRGIFSERNAQNPFVKVFSDADEAIKRATESTRGLSRELKESIVNLQKQNSAAELAKVKIENLIGAFSLRTDAANFRNPLDPEKVKADEQRYIRNFLASNPNYLFLKQQEFEARRRDTTDPLSFNGMPFDEFARRDILRNSGRVLDTPQGRLNRQISEQFDILFQRGISDQERTLADRKFISLTQGINPLELDERNRGRAADVREREAVRTEKQFQDAQTERKRQTALLEQVATELKVFNARALKSGREGVELLIKNESDSNVKVTSPKVDDVAEQYDFSGFGIAGGSNR